MEGARGHWRAGEALCSFELDAPLVHAAIAGRNFGGA